MKEGYRIISNGENYRIQKFYSFLKGIFVFTKTFSALYTNYPYVEEVVEEIKKSAEVRKNEKKHIKEMKKRPWTVVKTIAD